ncbi:glycerate kinase [Mariniluteicoccus flavus]
MKPTFVLAPDSFKESLTAQQACVALEDGLRESFPDATFVHVPMADGGEGTVQSLVDATGGRTVTTRVSGPLGDAVDATWGLLGDGQSAVIEMAEASGLGLVERARRDPRAATTRGTGELVLAALDAGVRRLIVGLGGSATNDAGAGMAQALGVRLLDADGNDLPPGGAALARLARIDASGLDPRVADLAVEVACDVSNPLCGREGASAIYGPQKGADPACVAELDAALAVFGERVRADLGRDVADIPGAGAAGGLGAGLLAFTDARLRSGVEIVIERAGLDAAVAGADVVITGEGRMDGQTRFGKTPFGVAQVGVRHGVPVIAIAGGLGEGVEELYASGFDAVFSVIPGVATLDEVLADAAANLTRTARNVGAVLRMGL